MSWLIDNANVLYILLGLAALGLLTAFWLNRRVKLLAYAAVPVALIVLVWLLTVFVPTDRKQIEHNVEAMADAVVRKDLPAFFQHVARDFRYKQMTRDQVGQVIAATVDQYKITEIKVWEFELEDVSRSNGSARGHFKTSVFGKDGLLGVVYCIARFTLEDGQWKLRAIELRDARNPDQPMPGAP